MRFRKTEDVFNALKSVTEERDELLLELQELKKDNSQLIKKLKDQDLVIDFLRKENKYLLPLYTCKLPKEKAIYFMSYLCSYYKVSLEDLKGSSRKGTLPFVRQISCYFLSNHFDWSIYDIRDYLECDRTMVIHNVQKIKDLLDIDREVLKDVLAHRDWLEKLDKI